MGSWPGFRVGVGVKGLAFPKIVGPALLFGGGQRAQPLLEGGLRSQLSDGGVAPVQILPYGGFDVGHGLGGGPEGR